MEEVNGCASTTMNRFLRDGQHHVSLLLHILFLVRTTAIQQFEILISPLTVLKSFFTNAQTTSTPDLMRS
ncbi:hypothetical protein T4A_4163 [Trichinella pseudospiralis]|uniref:Uncharacterized protein n=1 Tax=Trichinella pseudospiralis TaxID=6337 RepID=A0A0V1DU05_TRIPS|nr:hypothetical protein T4A_4163 [Trichinella pseudospiralis]